MKAQIQNPRKFTVQIRQMGTDVIVGTGFVVSERGEIVTCVHVVKEASETGEAAEGVEVGIYFPQARNKENKAHKATVAACFQSYEDDVVVLQLDSQFLPDGVEMAILGTAEKSAGNPFKSFGYRRLASYQGLPAEGKIIDLAECPPDRVLQADPVMLDSKHIDSGMSGGAVLDTERDLVIGAIAETWDSEERLKDRDTSFAVDSLVLTFDPMRLSVTDMPPPQATTPQPRIYLNNAPPPLKEWVGRAKFLETLDEDWTDPQCLITGLIGFGGEGKSSLTRRWLDNLLGNSSLPQPKGVFWWGFYERRDVDEFFEKLLTFLVEGIDLRYMSSVKVKAQVINAMLKSGRYLFVLDGLEVLQHQDGDDYGLLKNVDLRDWLREFAAGGHESFCLINSRAPLLDLSDESTPARCVYLRELIPNLG